MTAIQDLSFYIQILCRGLNHLNWCYTFEGCQGRIHINCFTKPFI